MAKHTPGPWRADLERHDYEIDIVGRPDWPCTRYGVEGDWDVAKIEILNDHDEETRANALLIASAPDLHKALKTALDHIEHMAAFIGNQKAGYSFESLGEDMPGMRAALSLSGVSDNG